MDIVEMVFWLVIVVTVCATLTEMVRIVAKNAAERLDQMGRYLGLIDEARRADKKKSVE